MTAAAVILRHEKDAVSAFRAAGAISPERARPPESLGLGHDRAIRRLQVRAVLRPGTQPGTLYLDEPSWVALRGIRRRFLLVILFIVLGLAFTTWYAASHGTGV